MASYSYQGRNKKGKLVKGKMMANSAETVANKLSAEGVIPVDIKEIKHHINWDAFFKFDFMTVKVKREELLNFCRQMFALYKAGVPITLSLARIAEGSRSKVMKGALDGVLKHIEAGMELAHAMRLYPDIFPMMMTNVIEVGENTGRLDEAFTHLGNYLELEDTTIKRLKSALRYPIIVIVSIVVAITILNLVVIPVFAKLFAGMKTQLPLLTRVLIGMSNFFVNYWLYMLLAIMICLIAFKVYLSTERGRYIWHFVILKIPFVGKIFRKIIYARFAHSFALVLRTDVPLANGIDLVANAVGNAYMAERIGQMKTLITHGESIINAARATKLFSPLVLQMLLVGEESGTIDDMLEQVAAFYEREVDYELQRLGQAIEPILLVIVGVMVLILALGIFLPMWNLTQIFTHKQ